MRRTPLLALVLMLAAPLGAQQLRPGLLAGRILGTDGAAVAEAVVRATQGARTIITRTDEDGDYRLAGLAGGGWTVSVRRLGYRPTAVHVDMPAEGLRRNFTVERVTPALDPVLVAAKWTGVRGIVGDARRLSPLAGASVRILGAERGTGSDTLGGFALALPGGRDALLRVERAGFATRLMSVAVPAEGYVELEVPLDTITEKPLDGYIWRDLDQRLKFATPRAVLVSRRDIEASNAVSLLTALQFSRQMQARGVVIDRRACVFVNGLARPSFPLDAIMADDVEFVEAYPPGTELTRTLIMSWPARAPCGAGDAPSRAGSSGARQVVQFVSVWLRAP
jgi:xanthine/CO dehydrogenase XdhC/CoxF family maturation factor